MGWHMLYHGTMRGIRKLRDAKLTNGDIADGIGYTVFAVRQWSRDARTPEPDAIRALVALGKKHGLAFGPLDFLPEDEQHPDMVA